MKLKTRTLCIAASMVLGALALAAPAGAHVTLQPNEAPAGGFVVEDVRVPNELDNASTTKVVVQLPDGFVEASYQPVPGWKAKVEKSKLAKPVKNDEGEEITEQVKQVTWSGGRIGPGQFQDFPLSVQVPGKEGDTLTFKALQTYSNGEVVRWIGAPDSESPAPQVKVTAAAGAGASQPATTSSKDSSDDDDDSKTLSIVALVVGGLGLLAGGAALARARRRV